MDIVNIKRSFYFKCSDETKLLYSFDTTEQAIGYFIPKTFRDRLKNE